MTHPNMIMQLKIFTPPSTITPPLVIPFSLYLNMESVVDFNPGARPKHKTTYSREHLTENPKPPKRTKAEVQQAALEKKEAAIEKKQQADEEKEKKCLQDKKERQISA